MSQPKKKKKRYTDNLFVVVVTQLANSYKLHEQNKNWHTVMKLSLNIQ